MSTNEMESEADHWVSSSFNVDHSSSYVPYDENKQYDMTMSTNETDSYAYQYGDQMASSFFDVDHISSSDYYGKYKQYDVAGSPNGSVSDVDHLVSSFFDVNHISSSDYYDKNKQHDVAMSTNETESDVDHWVTGLYDVNHLSTSNYYDENNQHGVAMSTNEMKLDSDHWVSGLFDVDHLSTSDYYGENKQQDMIQDQYFEYKNWDLGYNNVENYPYVTESTNESDLEANQFVSSLFNVDHLRSSNYYGENKHHEISQEQYSEYDNSNLDYNNVENNAHVLEEQLSHLSLRGSHEYFPNVDVYQYQDWQNPKENYYTGDVNVGSTYYANGGRSNDYEEYYTLGSKNESDLDGEVRKRLNLAFSVPHIPRINGDISSHDEEISDHQRLQDRLKLYDFIEHKVPEDGNCQFRALSDQLYNSQEQHEVVRKQVVNQLESNPDMYKDYVPMEYGEYLDNISKSGEWGDHVTLQAAADSYGVKIVILTSYKDTCYIEILPKLLESKSVVYLSFWAEVHYNSIYPQRD